MKLNFDELFSIDQGGLVVKKLIKFDGLLVAPHAVREYQGTTFTRVRGSKLRGVDFVRLRELMNIEFDVTVHEDVHHNQPLYLINKINGTLKTNEH